MKNIIFIQGSVSTLVQIARFRLSKIDSARQNNEDYVDLVCGDLTYTISIKDYVDLVAN